MLRGYTKQVTNKTNPILRGFTHYGHCGATLERSHGPFYELLGVLHCYGSLWWQVKLTFWETGKIGKISVLNS